MKLRNKETGKIWDIGKILTNDYPSYDRLKDIIDDFEDITQEPLVKDKEIRKIIRSWAKINNIKNVSIIEYRYITTIWNEHMSITFCRNLLDIIDSEDYTISELYRKRYYSITELCGEE